MEILGFNTRVIAVLQSGDSEKLETLRKVAESLAHRTNLRLGLITDESIVSDFKREDDGCMHSKSDQILLYRHDNECLSIAFEDPETLDIRSLTQWISFNSAKKPDTLQLGSAQLAD